MVESGLTPGLFSLTARISVDGLPTRLRKPMLKLSSSLLICLARGVEVRSGDVGQPSWDLGFGSWGVVHGVDIGPLGPNIAKRMGSQRTYWRLPPRERVPFLFWIQESRRIVRTTVRNPNMSQWIDEIPRRNHTFSSSVLPCSLHPQAGRLVRLSCAGREECSCVPRPRAAQYRVALSGV